MGLGNWKRTWAEVDRCVEDLVREGDRLVPLLGGRTIPRPPVSLLEVGDPSVESGLDGLEWQVARAHWNGFVLMLREDGSGYATLIGLLARLREAVAELRGPMISNAQAATDMQRAAEAVLQVLDAGRGEYGGEELLGATLGGSGRESATLTPSWLQEGWSWQRSVPKATLEGVSAETSVSYTLQADHEYDGVGSPLLRRPVFGAEDTWDQAAESYRWMSTRAVEILTSAASRASELEVRRELLRYRRQVAEAVLFEFETLGHVHLLGQKPDHKFVYGLTIAEAKVVRAMADVVPDVPADRSSRDGWMTAAADSLGIEKREAIKTAVEAGVYVERGGGRRTAQFEENELKDMIDAVMDRLAEADLVLAVGS